MIEIVLIVVLYFSAFEIGKSVFGTAAENEYKSCLSVDVSGSEPCAPVPPRN